MIPVRIIGMGMGVNDLPARNLQLIEQSDVLVGGKRHLDDFMGLACQKLEIRSPIANVVQAIRQSMESRRVVILASGDPLFFGIGRILMRELGEENVEILPNYSCLTAAFARIKKPWANLPVVSLHGRAGEHALAGALVESPFVFVLTGPGQGSCPNRCMADRQPYSPCHVACYGEYGLAEGENPCAFAGPGR